MLTLSPRVLAAFAFERGEEFDPALTLVSTPLADDLARSAAHERWSVSCHPRSADGATARGESAARASEAPARRRCLSPPNRRLRGRPERR